VKYLLLAMTYSWVLAGMSLLWQSDMFLAVFLFSFLPIGFLMGFGVRSEFHS